MRSFSLATMAGCAALHGCSGDDSVTLLGAAPGSETEEAGPAVVVVVDTQSPEATSYYMGAYPSMPSAIDVSQMVELGPDAYRSVSFNGSVYTWSGETLSWTRWTVDAGLRFARGPEMSLTGLAISDALHPAFVSPTQAFLFNLAEGTVIEFNPTSMEIVRTIAVEPPPVTAGVPSSWESFVIDGRVLVPINAEDFDTLEFDDQARTAAVFDPASGTITYLSDPRMTSGFGGFVDESGNLYYPPSRFVNYMMHYGAHDPAGYAPVNGMLRIKPGEDRFDPDFFVRLDEITGAPASWNTSYLGSGKLLQLTFEQDPATWPAHPDDWWGMERTKRIIDMATWTSTKLEGPVVESWKAAWWPVGEVDGTRYFALGNATSDGWTTSAALARYTDSGFEVLAESEGGGFLYVGRLR